MNKLKKKNQKSDITKMAIYRWFQASQEEQLTTIHGQDIAEKSLKKENQTKLTEEK